MITPVSSVPFHTRIQPLRGVLSVALLAFTTLAGALGIYLVQRFFVPPASLVRLVDFERGLRGVVSCCSTGF